MIFSPGVYGFHDLYGFHGLIGLPVSGYHGLIALLVLGYIAICSYNLWPFQNQKISLEKHPNIQIRTAGGVSC